MISYTKLGEHKYYNIKSFERRFAQNIKRFFAIYYNKFN